MDFKESLYVSRISDSLYNVVWSKEDLASGELIECDWELHCNSTVLCDFLNAHYYDIIEVGKTFNDPNNTLYTKIEEY